MNLGRHRRITNDELRDAFARIGMADVATFRASGNVGFTVRAGGSEASIVGTIERGLEQELGYPVATFVRDGVAVREIAAARPFDERQLTSSKGKLQVCILGAPAPAPVRDALRELAADADGVEFAGRELYWLPSGGVLESALDMATLARLLGPMTVRTKATIEQFAAKHFVV
jgi:uncharacterized protein (DUF1697 family)